MKLEVKTKTGSVYILDKELMTWERKVAGAGSNGVRTQGGPLEAWPVILVGEGVEMFGPPLDPTKYLRVIYTSDVMSWKEIE